MSELNSHICFDALATLQNAERIENVCNFCGADHYTDDCPVLCKGQHVLDNTSLDLSRLSVPNGLHVLDDSDGSCVITSQKFAKGSRFGPLIARKSCIPIENVRFPLMIFGNVIPSLDIPELRELFKVRNEYLDTTNESCCNWMIHVNPAKYANEQNLVAYQEENQIFFTAIQDIDIGDILKVWYAPKYANEIKIPLLQSSSHEIINNILRQVSIDHNGLDFEPNDFYNNMTDLYSTYSCTGVSLPPIQSIIKSQSTFQNTGYITPDLHIYNMDNIPETDNETKNLLNTSLSTISIDSDVFDNSFDLLNGSFDSNIIEIENSKINKEIADQTESIESLSQNSSIITSVKDDSYEKQIYFCEICDRKYATMTNIYKHMRTHNLFLCSLCTKTFATEALIKNHECSHRKIKTPQCGICFKYLSNTWSLTRHMKVHGISNCSSSESSVDGTNKETTTTSTTTTATLPFLTSTQISQPDVMSCSETNSELDKTCTIELQTSNGQTKCNRLVTIKTEIGKDMDYICIVCEKKFKTQTRLENHLYCSHTVKVGKPKKPKKGSINQLKSPTVDRKIDSTQNSSPVNPFTAKALATKLKRNTKSDCFLLAALPSLTPITSNSREPPKNVPITQPVLLLKKIDLKIKTNDVQEKPNAFGQVICNSDGREEKLIQNDFKENVKKVCDNKTLMETHKCDMCSKEFIKKYQLLRHKQTHENSVYTCPFCDCKSVKCRGTIVKHFKSMHPNLKNEWNRREFLNSLKRKMNDEEMRYRKSVSAIIPKNTQVPNRTEKQNIGVDKIFKVQKSAKEHNHTKLPLDIMTDNLFSKSSNNTDCNKPERKRKFFSEHECDLPVVKRSKNNLGLSKQLMLTSSSYKIRVDNPKCTSNHIDNTLRGQFEVNDDGFVVDRNSLNLAQSPMSSIGDGLTTSEHSMTTKALLDKFQKTLEDMEERQDDDCGMSYWTDCSLSNEDSHFYFSSVDRFD